MCIRDSVPADEETIRYLREEAGVTDPIEPVVPDADAVYWLLYTSDAADERSSVALGGRRIIKKKNNRRSCVSPGSYHSSPVIN